MNTQAYLDSYKDGKLFGDTENLAVNMQGKRGAVAIKTSRRSSMQARRPTSQPSPMRRSMCR